MHTSWRATVAHVLLLLAGVLSIVVALALSFTGNTALVVAAAWITAGLISAGVAASWFQYRRAERFRRQLATGLTHHMRTSLAHIQAYDEMLLLGRETSEHERRDWLEVIGREAERLGSAVENLLLLVNDRKRDAYPIRHAVDLGALLEDVACDYSGTGATRLRFEQNPPSGVMVEADPAALRHALGNLLQGVGGCCEPAHALTAALTTNGSTATVCVDHAEPHSRNGSHRGSPFRESDLEGDTGEGFGLEIAVVQHVARAHGGRAVPYQTSGRTGYRLELPLAQS